MRTIIKSSFITLIIAFLYFTIVLIESGNVGVRKTLGKVNPEESNRPHRPDTQGCR